METKENRFVACIKECSTMWDVFDFEENKISELQAEVERLINEVECLKAERLVKNYKLLNMEAEVARLKEDLESISRWDKNYREIAIEQIEKVHALEQALLEAKSALETCYYNADDDEYNKIYRFDNQKIEKALASISALNLGERNER